MVFLVYHRGTRSVVRLVRLNGPSHRHCGRGQDMLAWRKRASGVRCGGFPKSVSCCVDGRAIPREVNHDADSPAIEDALRRGVLLQPANGCKVLPGGFYIAQVEVREVGNPGGFTEPAGMTLAVAVIEAAEQMAEYRGDDRAAAPPAI